MPSFGDCSPCTLTTNVFLLPLLTAVETVLAVGVATTYLTQHGLLRWFALAAMVLAVGFMAWIARLLLTKSDLPCACSFSEGPTSIWSFARSVCVGLVGVFALVAGPDRLDATTLGERVAILAVGCAVASAIFVLPEAITWPPASKASTRAGRRPYFEHLST